MNRRKIPIVLKTTILLVFLGFVQVYGKSIYPQEPIVNLNLKGATLVQAFEEIEKQSNYIFFYNDRDINRRVRVHANLYSRRWIQSSPDKS